MPLDSRPERIFDRIEISPDGCWLYQGGISASGYGVVSIKNKSVNTHRLAYIGFRGRRSPTRTTTSRGRRDGQ